MKATNEELTEAFITLSSVVAGMLEFNATIAKIVLSSSVSQDESQQRILADLENIPKLASGLREAIEQLKRKA